MGRVTPFPLRPPPPRLTLTGALPLTRPRCTVSPPPEITHPRGVQTIHPLHIHVLAYIGWFECYTDMTTYFVSTKMKFALKLPEYHSFIPCSLA